MAPDALAQRRRRAAIYTATAIPVLEILAFAFASYVFTGSLATEYLIRDGGRVGAAVVVLVLYWILFILAIGPLIRNIVTLSTNPPYSPKHITSESELEKGQSQTRTPPGEQNNWNPGDRTAYVCQGDGLPHRCNFCQAWKPDRAHHSSDVGRCINRMDHFCPWFAGIIGDTNTKYFIQFCAFVALWCIFGVITLAIFINEQRVAGTTNTHNFITMCICLGLMAFFFNFTASMTFMTVQRVFKNITDVEAIQKQPWTIAININHLRKRRGSERGHSGDSGNASEPGYAMRYFWADRTQYVPAAGVKPEMSPDLQQATAFAIVTARAEENPFDLGDPYANWKSVMGNNFLDWIFPIRGSPESLDSFGPLVGVLADRHGVSRRA